jgi:hypothetical protein
LFTLADVRRSDQPMLVHCDGTGEGVDFVIALLVISDRMPVDKAIERVTRKSSYISLRPTSRRQLRGFGGKSRKRKGGRHDCMNTCGGSGMGSGIDGTERAIGAVNGRPKTMERVCHGERAGSGR